MKKMLKSNLLKIINEEIIEGVGDTYLKNKYNIPNEFSGFDKQYDINQIKNRESMQNDVIVYTEGNWNLIKNPSTLNNFGSSVRGVILNNGDFYLESFTEKIHFDILNILYKLKIINDLPKRNWSNRLPQEVGVLTVQRYKNSPNISIGESNRLIYNQTDYDKYIRYYDEFLNKARLKCPNINFTNKLVGTKFFKVASESVLMQNN